MNPDFLTVPGVKVQQRLKGYYVPKLLGSSVCTSPVVAVFDCGPVCRVFIQRDT